MGKYIHVDLHVQIPTPIHLHCDSNSIMQIDANPAFHEMTKHIDIDCHIIKNEYKTRLIDLIHLSNSE